MKKRTTKKPAKKSRAQTKATRKNGRHAKKKGDMPDFMAMSPEERKAYKTALKAKIARLKAKMAANKNGGQ